MCLIAYSPSGVPPEKCLANGLVNNPDGWGYAFPVGEGKLVVRKGIDNNQFWDTLDEDSASVGSAPFLWHARWATHGKVKEKNCHPFRLPEKFGEMVLAHNGIISSCSYDKKKSDTLLFIETVLSRLSPGFHENEEVMFLLSRMIGWSKIAFMAGSGAVHILNEECGLWKDGVWYSNDGYLPPVKTVYSPPAKSVVVAEREIWTPSGNGSSAAYEDAKLWDGDVQDCYTLARYGNLDAESLCDALMMDRDELAHYLGVEMEDLDHQVSQLTPSDLDNVF